MSGMNIPFRKRVPGLAISRLFGIPSTPPVFAGVAQGIFGLLTLLLLPTAVFAQEIIPDFRGGVSLASTYNLTLTEYITYDFGDVPRHGIFRYIPVTYERDGGTYRLRLTVTGVTRDGKAEPYETSSSGGKLEVKIGDKDVLISGSHKYAISYVTDRAVNFFPDHDELYWNVTGNDWPVEIEKTLFSVTLPTAMDPAAVTSTCFTGSYGSTEQACTTIREPHGITFVTTRVLLPGEGFTIVIGMPKGILKEPSALQRILWVLADNGVLFIPIIAFLIMFWMWWMRGRDPELGTVIPEYEPPMKLTPAVTGAAMTDGDVPARTVTATIIDLARRGYLKIRFGEEKRLFGDKQTFTFVKAKPADATLSSFEKILLDGLFAGGGEQTVEDLKKQKFYEDVKSFKKDVQTTVDGLKIYDAEPNKTRGKYIVLTVILVGAMFFFFGSTGLGVASAIATGLIMGFFGWFMPRRNLKGVKLLASIKGFKWFLSVTEKDRLDFHNAPERTPAQFMALLPFAIVFAVEKKWAEQFASLNVPPPTWAEGASTANWSTLYFVSSLNTLHTTASASAFSPPSQAGSGGSGFSGGGSGGGFGGGGGGSW